MTLEEILKAQGLNDDQIKSTIGEMKQNKIFTAAEENLDVRYGKLKTDHEGTAKQLTEAQALIEQLKKSNAGNEDLQGQITKYEEENKKLEAALAQTKLDAAVKVALLSEKANDIDYLTYKLKEQGELAIDEKGEIKGWKDKLTELKTKFPTQFSTETKKIIENRLKHGNPDDTITKESFDKMTYAQKVQLHKENPDAYDELSGNKEV